jgi:hypothetical protein
MLTSIPKKSTQLFLGFPTSEGDAPAAVVRVSRYLRDEVTAQPDGTTRIVPRHIRLSIWEVDRPISAVSLTESEASRLASFLRESPNAEPETHAGRTGTDGQEQAP